MQHTVGNRRFAEAAGDKSLQLSQCSLVPDCHEGVSHGPLHPTNPNCPQYELVMGLVRGQLHSQ
jgi:hypothetical protein